MGREIGKITEIDGKSTTVQLHTGEQCSVCAAKTACVFAGPNSNYRFIEVPTVEGIRQGEMVYLEYKESPRIMASLIVFLLPILFIIAGYFAGTGIVRSQNSGIWGAVAGFLLSVPVLYILNRWIERSKWFSPRISGRAPATGMLLMGKIIKNSGG